MDRNNSTGHVVEKSRNTHSIEELGVVRCREFTVVPPLVSRPSGAGLDRILSELVGDVTHGAADESSRNVINGASELQRFGESSRWLILHPCKVRGTNRLGKRPGRVHRCAQILRHGYSPARAVLLESSSDHLAETRRQQI